MNRIVTGILSLVALIVVLFVLALFFGIAFIVPETHSAVVTRFGEVRQAVVTGFYKAPGTKEVEPPDHIIDKNQIEFMRERYEENRPEINLSIGAGLHFKVPWPIEEVHYFDSRLLDWDGQRTEVATKDLRTLLVDSASRWRILDPVQFYEAVGPSQHHAQGRLDEVIGREIEDQITVTLLIETVRNQNLSIEKEVRELLESEQEEKTIEEELDEENQLRYGRMEVIRQIQEEAGNALRERFGIRLIDVMITELNYSEEVQKRVFDRMTAERERIASRYRAEGEETKQQILGEVEERRRKILGNAHGKEIEIVGSAHDRDREFYRFYRSLQAFDVAFDTQSVFLLSDENQLLEYTTEAP